MVFIWLFGLMLAVPVLSQKNFLIRRNHLRVLLFFWVILACFFWKTLLPGDIPWPADLLFGLYPWKACQPQGFTLPHNPLLADLSFQVFPWMHYAKESMGNGILPLWNPYSFSGAPFIANCQSAVFFPLNFLIYVLPFGDAISAISFSQLFLAGSGMYFFLFHLGLKKEGAVVGGMVFMLNGFLVVWSGYPMANVVILAPLFFLAVDKLVKKRNGLTFFLFTLLTAIQFLAGHPESSLLLFLPLTCYFCLRLWAVSRKKQKNGNILKPIAFFFGGAGIGAFLVSFQLLPFIEYLRLSSRFAFFTSLEKNPFHLPFTALIKSAILLIVPDFYGNPIHHNWWGDIGNYNELTGYIGIPAIVLAFLSLFLLKKKDRTVMFFFGLAFFSLAVVYQFPLIFDFLACLPLFNIIGNHRFLFLFSFSGAVLAAKGFDMVKEAITDRLIKQKLLRTTTYLCPLGLIFASLIFCLFFYAIKHHGLLGYELKNIFLFLLFFLSSLAVLYLYLKEKIGDKMFVYFFFVLILSDLFIFGINYHPAIAKKNFYPRTELIEFLQKKDGLFRITGIGFCFPPGMGTVYGLMDIRGDDAVKLDRYERFLSLMGSYSPIFPGQIENLDSCLLDFLNLKYLLANPDYRGPEGGGKYRLIYQGKDGKIFENSNVYPRAFLVEQAVLIKEDDKILEILKDGGIDLRQTVIVGEKFPCLAEGNLGDKKGIKTVKITGYQPGKIAIKTETSRNSFLVLSEVFYPGWKIYVDNKEEKIYRANYCFRAVYLPAGRHEVVFYYRPKSFNVGAILSLATLVIFLVTMAGAYSRFFRKKVY